MGDDDASAGMPGADGRFEPHDRSVRALVTIGMALTTAALVLVLWPLLGLSDVGAAAVGCFLAMSIVVGFTSMGRAMTEDLQVWRSTRTAIGRRGLREGRRAIKAGRAVHDPALALCTIRMAERTRLRLTRAVPWWWYALIGGLMVLSAANGNVVGVVVLGLAVVAVSVLRLFKRGHLEKVERSIVANRRLLDRG